MDEYYRKIQDKLLIQKDMIDALLKNQNTRVRSDYYEAIVRDLVRENVPKSFSVSRGIVLNEEGQNSEECDLILYESSSFDTWFQSGEIVVISPEAVRAVIEIKRTLNRRSIEDAVSSLRLVNKLRSGIFKFIIGFNTNESYVALNEQCIQSRTVNGMFVFNSKISEDRKSIKAEMKRFIEVIKQITSTSIYAGFNAKDYFIHKVSEPMYNRFVDTVEDDGFVVTHFDKETDSN